MKKVLFGTTALVAAGLMAAPANAAEKIKLGLGGYYQTMLNFVDMDSNPTNGLANLRSDQVVQEGEIYFEGKTTLDNGLTVGVQVQLEGYTNGSDQIDEHFVFFEGDWGRINFGAENSAAYLMHYGAPSAVAGHGVNSPNFFHFNDPNGNDALWQVGPTTFLNATSDANKLTYFTPRFSGFQFGVSYTPDTASAGGSSGSYGVLTDNDADQQEQVVELGANYVQNLGGVDLAISGGYLKGSNENKSAGRDDQTAWNLGFNVGVGGFTIGAAYIKDDRGYSSDNDGTGYNVGVTYGMNAWKVGAGYAHQEVEQGAGVAEDEVDYYEVGGSYVLGPGVTLTAGIHWISYDGPTQADESDGTSFVVGSALSF